MAGLEFAVAGSARHEMRRSFVFLTSEIISRSWERSRPRPIYNAEDAGECKHPGRRCQLRIWKRHGGRNDFVGSTLQINGQPYTVIRHFAKGFCGASALIAPDIWLRSRAFAARLHFG